MNVLVGVVAVAVAAAWATAVGRSALRRRQVRHEALVQVGLRQRRQADPEAEATVSRRVRQVALAVASAAVGVVLVGPVGVVFAGAPALVGAARTSRQRRKRAEALASGLAPALQLVVDNLRVGRDLVSALNEVATTVPDPMASVLASVVAEVRLGARVDEALLRQAEAEGDRHLAVVASGVGLHVEHGGNLVEILTSVVETIEEEDRLRRNIATITADGKMSGQVLLALPLVTLLAVSLLSPGYATPLVAEPLGRMMTLVALVLGVAGWLWLRRLSNMEVVG